MSHYLQLLIKEGTNPRSIRIWVSEWRGHRYTYVSQGERLIPLQAWVKERIHKMPPKQATELIQNLKAQLHT